MLIPIDALLARYAPDLDILVDSSTPRQVLAITATLTGAPCLQLQYGPYANKPPDKPDIFTRRILIQRICSTAMRQATMYVPIVTRSIRLGAFNVLNYPGPAADNYATGSRSRLIIPVSNAFRVRYLADLTDL